MLSFSAHFFFQAEDGIRDFHVTGVQTCALPISAHDDHTPELGVEDAESNGSNHKNNGDCDAPDAAQVAFDQQSQCRNDGARGHDPGELAGGGAQHGVERREVPHRRNVLGCIKRIGRNEVVVFQEETAHFRSKEHNGREDDQEARNAHDVVNRVIGVERDAVEREATAVFGAVFDFDAVGVVGAYFVQRDQVSHNQTDQDQRNGNDVKREEAVQGSVGDDIVTANPDGQFGPDKGDGSKQVNDDLCTPVGHLAPGQQVAHEGFGHQAKENGDAENPDQFAGLAVRAVKQATQHVQINHHEEHGCAGGVHVADEPAPRHFAHDVFKRVECQVAIGLVVHDQEDTGHDLNDQHQQCQ